MLCKWFLWKMQEFMDFLSESGSRVKFNFVKVTDQQVTVELIIVI